MYKFGRGSLKRAEGVNPDLIECAKRALSRSKYDMTIPWMGGVRSAEDQHKIYLDGNSKCDGYENLSYHQTGNAIDVIPVGNIEAAYKNTRALNYFARLMLEEWQDMLTYGEATGIMVWGGTFGSTGWDKPHFEVHI